MKLLLAILLVATLSASAMAAEDPNKIVVINGKKFFPLRNARTFSGTKKPMPAVIAGKQPHAMPIAHSSALPLSKPVENNTLSNSTANTTSDNNAPNSKAASDVLSVFAPQEKP